MHKESTESFTTTSKQSALIMVAFGAFMTPFDGSKVETRNG